MVIAGIVISTPASIAICCGNNFASNAPVTIIPSIKKPIAMARLGHFSI